VSGRTSGQRAQPERRITTIRHTDLPAEVAFDRVPELLGESE